MTNHMPLYHCLHRGGHAPGRVMRWLGGQSPRIGDTIGYGRGAAELSPAYLEHVNAGHVFVSDQTGSYWTDKDGRPLVDDGETHSESEEA